MPKMIQVITHNDWLTGDVGAAKATSPRHEIEAIIKSLKYAGEQISFSNYDNGNIAKAVRLLRLMKRRAPVTKRKSRR